MEGKVNYNYQRVIPRDLFNESKLLKCLGQLSLLVHDGKVNGITVVDTGRPFRIGLHEAGYVTTGSEISFQVGQKLLWLGTTYNSKDPYPLICFDNWEEIEVFRDNGEITQEFANFLTVSNQSNESNEQPNQQLAH